jgi:hypothetical protein
MSKDQKKRVLEIFREFYPGTETDAEILKINPNSFDMDPEGFYEALIDEFNLEVSDADSFYGLEGIGGKVSKVIEFIGRNNNFKPVQNSNPFKELDLLFGNIALAERNSDLLDKNLKSCLNMFKYELRSNFKTLKKEAAIAIELKQFNQVLKLARKSKVKQLNEENISAVLHKIVDY